jgi:hypothetical protein
MSVATRCDSCAQRLERAHFCVIGESRTPGLTVMGRTFRLLRLWIVGTIAGLGLLVAGCGSSSSVTTGPDPAKCQLTISTPAAIVAQGGAASVSVTTQPECEWTASTQANWITDVSPSSGQGNGSGGEWEPHEHC